PPQQYVDHGNSRDEQHAADASNSHDPRGGAQALLQPIKERLVGEFPSQGFGLRRHRNRSSLPSEVSALLFARKPRKSRPEPSNRRSPSTPSSWSKSNG